VEPPSRQGRGSITNSAARGRVGIQGAYRGRMAAL
jgi:hypothetical protein